MDKYLLSDSCLKCGSSLSKGKEDNCSMESAEQAVQPQKPTKFANIKDDAIRQWSKVDTSVTTYGYFFDDPSVKVKQHLRPSSPTRRNNPHPPREFMYFRIRDIPDLKSVDTNVDKAAFKVEKKFTSKLPTVSEKFATVWSRAASAGPQAPTAVAPAPEPYHPFAYFSQMKQSEFQVRLPRRGDFLIHPDWPATLHNHKLPCLH